MTSKMIFLAVFIIFALIYLSTQKHIETFKNSYSKSILLFLTNKNNPKISETARNMQTLLAGTIDFCVVFDARSGLADLKVWDGVNIFQITKKLLDFYDLKPEKISEISTYTSKGAHWFPLLYGYLHPYKGYYVIEDDVTLSPLNAWVDFINKYEKIESDFIGAKIGQADCWMGTCKGVFPTNELVKNFTFIYRISRELLLDYFNNFRKKRTCHHEWSFASYAKTKGYTMSIIDKNDTSERWSWDNSENKKCQTNKLCHPNKYWKD